MAQENVSYKEAVKKQENSYSGAVTSAERVTINPIDFPSLFETRTYPGPSLRVATESA